MFVFQPVNAFNQNNLTRSTPWLLLLVLIYSYILVRSVSKLHKTTASPVGNILKWLLLLVVLIFPLAYIGRFPAFEEPVATSVGFALRPQVFLFSLLPAAIALGTIGLWPAILISILTVAFQALIMVQEPFMSFVYAFYTLNLARLLSRQDDQVERPLQAHPAILSLSAWYLSLLPLVLNQALISILAGEANLAEILRQIFTMAVAYLPSGLMAALLVFALDRMLKEAWQPKAYLNSPSRSGDLEYLTTTLARLAEGEYGEPIDTKSRDPYQALVLNAIEGLRQALVIKTDAQERLLAVDSSAYSRESYDLALAGILRAALGRDASSARVVLFNTELDALDQSPRLRLGQGDKTRLYAYLDFAILQQIGDLPELALSDLKPDAYFGLGPGSPAPQALIVQRLAYENNPLGILWVGFEENTWFTQEDLHFYKQLADRTAMILATRERVARLQSENVWLRNAFDALNQPLTIIDGDGHTVLENQAAQAIAKIQAAAGELPEIHEVSDSGVQPLPAEADNSFGTERTVRQTISGFGAQAGTLITREASPSGEIEGILQEKDLASLTHGLRSPLKMVDGYLRLLSKIGNLNEEQERYLAKIDENLDYMNVLVGRTQNGNGEPDSTIKSATFDIRQLIDTVLSLVSLQAQQARVELVTDFSRLRNPYMMGDNILIRQAIYSLVENAIRYSNRGGRVVIKAYKDYDWLHLEIQDQGKGIAPLDQSSIFESERSGKPEEESNATTTLAMVKRIIERHEGRVQVRSNLGSGTLVQIDLPLKRSLV